MNSDSGKYRIRNGNSSQVRTSALSHSLKVSAKLNPPLQTHYSSSTPSEKHGEESVFENSNGVSPNRSKPTEDVMDGVQSTPPDRKLHDSDQDAELLSKSLPALTVNATSNGSPKASARKHSGQTQSGSSSVQSKISQNTKTDKGTPKSSENTSQVKLSSSLPRDRSPTPKMFFNNLINRLSGRMSGNSPSSSPDSRSSSSSSSRASTPSIMEQNVALSFRLSADEFTNCDHKLKLFFEVSLFRFSSEEFRCMLKVRCLRKMCVCVCVNPVLVQVVTAKT